MSEVNKPATEEEVRWYVVNTYSGHENRVKENLERRVESMGIQDNLFRIIVAEEEDIEIKNGKQVSKMRNLFPGYIFVEMRMTDEAWYVVRNTPGVTGFLGSSGKGAKPVPLYPDEAYLNSIYVKENIINNFNNIDVDRYITINPDIYCDTDRNTCNIYGNNFPEINTIFINQKYNLAIKDNKKNNKV